MLVKEVMSKSPTFLPPTATIQEASEKMAALDCGFIPVGENDHLIGAVTDRDITIRATAKGLDPKKTCLKDIMTSKILYCFENDDITDIASNMSGLQVHRLAVVNEDKRLTGILALKDIACNTHDADLCGHLVESISQD